MVYPARRGTEGGGGYAAVFSYVYISLAGVYGGGDSLYYSLAKEYDGAC